MHMHFSRLMLVLASVLFLGLTPASAQGRATITFDNKSGEPALVKVVGPTRHRVQVPNRATRTVRVTGGSYHILVRYGSKPENYRYTRGDRFNVTQTSRRYSVIRITLHKVAGGNYGSRSSSAGEFGD